MNVMFIFVLIFVIIVIWLFGFLYNMWNPVMADITPKMEEFVNYSENQTGISSASGRTAIANVRSVWKYWPIVLLLFLFIWVLVASQKTEPNYISTGGY